MARIEVGPRIVGLREFRNELRKADKALPKELTKANREHAAKMVAPIRSAYSKRFRVRSGRTIGSVRPFSTQTSAGIRFGGARLPHAMGQEWGSNRFPQFAPWTGGDGRFVYPTISAEAPKLMAEYGKVLSAVMGSAYPDRRR